MANNTYWFAFVRDVFPSCIVGPVLLTTPPHPEQQPLLREGPRLLTLCHRHGTAQFTPEHGLDQCQLHRLLSLSSISRVMRNLISIRTSIAGVLQTSWPPDSHQAKVRSYVGAFLPTASGELLSSKALSQCSLVSATFELTCHGPLNVQERPQSTWQQRELRSRRGNQEICSVAQRFVRGTVRPVEADLDRPVPCGPLQRVRLLHPRHTPP